jgi:hypothetical protein
MRGATVDWDHIDWTIEAPPPRKERRFRLNKRLAVLIFVLLADTAVLLPLVAASGRTVYYGAHLGPSATTLPGR